jgi:putative hydroxymethylpyrimidine transport system substrate-binding protein
MRPRHPGRAGARPRVYTPWMAVLLVGALALGIVACGDDDEETGATAEPQRIDLALDFYVNPDHAGVYAALEKGFFARRNLDVRPRVPSDPSAPIKQVAARRADLAISYEPEVFLARAQGLPVVAVAALVQRPLTSLIAIGKERIRRPADLRGKRVGTAGIPYQSAYLRTILEQAGVDPGSVREVNVGFNLTPAMLSGKVDATLGSFWNYEGVDLARRKRDPRILRMEDLGVPAYDELVFAARREDLDEDGASRLRRFLQATARGHERLRKDATVGVDALLEADDGLDRDLQAAAVDATLPAFFPGDDRPFGFQDPEEWAAYE